MFCQKCGKQIPDNSIQCPYCGQITGAFNDTLQPYAEQNKPKKKIYQRWWFWVLIVIAVIIILPALATSGSEKPKKIQSTTANDNASQEVVADHTLGKSTTNSSKGNVGNYNLELKSASIAHKNNKSYLIVNYIFTNNSDENRSFENAVTCKAFQNGIECGTLFYTGGIDGYDIELGRRELQPGKSFEVQDLYELNDNTTPVEIQVSLFSVWSDEVYKTFNVSLKK